MLYRPWCEVVSLWRSGISSRQLAFASSAAVLTEANTTFAAVRPRLCAWRRSERTAELASGGILFPCCFPCLPPPPVPPSLPPPPPSSSSHDPAPPPAPPAPAAAPPPPPLPSCLPHEERAWRSFSLGLARDVPFHRSISALAAAPVVSSAATAIHPWASPAAAGAGCWLPSPVARAPVLPAWPASPQHLPQHPLPQQHQPPQPPPPPPPPRLLAWDSPPPPAAVMKIEDLSAAAPGSVQHPHLSSPVQRVMASDPGMVQSQQSDSAPTILTVRMIMQGKEVGSIIGKKGDNIKKFREESGAKINISDGSCPERVVTITGTTDAIYKAFTLICNKFEEVTIPVLQEMGNSSPTVPKPPVTLRLVVPASQCGSLIGKGGCKIKEIRESTGASIQVASEMLPNSTERAVTVSGTAEAITECIRHVCTIMLESPPKGANIPYRPKPVVSPVIFAGGQAYSLPPGQMGMPAPEMAKMPHGMPMPHPVPTIIPSPQTLLPGGGVPVNVGAPGYYARPEVYPNNHVYTMYQPSFTAMHFPRPANPNVPAGQQSHEITIPNDLIGCIIGRGGQKINEIRQLSGANIKIANAEEGSSDRKVTITGAPEMIGLAQYLINTSMEMHKHLTLDPTPTPTTLTSCQSPAPLAIPMTQVLKPVPYLGINQMGIVEACPNNTNFTAKMRVGLAANSVKKDRPKFAPY